MPTPTPKLFKILSDDNHWAIVQHLQMSDLKASELSAALNLPADSIEQHIGNLREAGLLRERRTTTSREPYYHLLIEVLSRQFQEAGGALHPAIFEAHDRAAPETVRLQNAVRILFLCTHNSARSQIAEGLARHMGAGLVEAFSAGTEATSIKPEAVEVMKRRGIDITTQHSKVLTEYLDQEFDYVITVCDAARESCPFFAGGKIQLHWSFDDPAAVEGKGRLAAFEQSARQIATRIGYLITIIAKQQRADVPRQAIAQTAM